MEFDFTTILERHGKDAISVDGIGSGGTAPAAPKQGFDVIPMWVADMNFATVPSVTKAMQERLTHPLFGYFEATDAYYDAIINWHKERNGVHGLTKAHIGYENGVLGGLVSALCAFSACGDHVLVHSPTYIGFTKSIENVGRHIVHSPLKKDAAGIWRMDYADMEEKLKKYHIHVAVFCSPHNPCGRVWEKAEIAKAMELFQKYDCIVISDEIWSDILLDGHKHIPTQAVSEDAKHRTIALYAPSKTFNLAGLIGSYHIVYDSYLRDRLLAQASKSHYNAMNVMSIHALLGAYSAEGHRWVDELCQVLSQNIDYAYTYCKEHFSGVTCMKPQGTYMLFLDCSQWCQQHHTTIQTLLQAGWDVGVAWQDGEMFHGPCCIRMNVALPLSRVQEAFKRLHTYVFTDAK